MSRPRYYWYNIVKTIISHFPNGLNKSTPKGKEAFQCITEAMKYTVQLPDGNDRIKMIEMVMINKTHKLYGAAMVSNVSESTAKRWMSDFIYLVADKMGYMQKAVRKGEYYHEDKDHL